MSQLRQTPWKHKNHCSGPQEKGRPCENDLHLQYLIEFLYPVILLPQPRSRGPAAMFQPSRRRCQSGCFPGWDFLWSCWHESRRRGPAELAKSRTKSWWSAKAFHIISLQLCWTTCIVNWQFRMSRLSLVPTHVKSSRHHPTHSILYISSHLRNDLLPPCFSSLSQGHSLQYLFNENTFRTTYPSAKRMRFLKGRWTSKLLRLRSLQVDPPIHSTKSDVNVLAKTDSLKTQKSLLRSQEKGRTCENDIHLQYLIEFLYPVILLPQPRSRGPAAVFQPSHLHLRSGCDPGRPYLWSCSRGTRRRGPAELARGKGQVDSRLVGVSLQLCWTTCIVNWPFRMSAFLHCQTPSSPAKLGLRLPTPAEPSAAHHRYLYRTGRALWWSGWTGRALWWSGWGATCRPGPGAKCATKQKTHRPGHWHFENRTNDQMETEQGKS